MRKLCVVLLIAASCYIASQDATACGDKFLFIGRGTRFGRTYAAIHPASILIYVNPNSPHAAVMRDPQLVSSLKQAGHRVRTVVDLHALSTSLNSDAVDIVLADFSDVTALDSRLETTLNRATLLPVLYRPTKEEASGAAQRFPFSVKAPDRATHILNVIDDLMTVRVKAQSPAAPVGARSR
jgi:hypothetical protein